MKNISVNIMLPETKGNSFMINSLQLKKTNGKM